MTKNDPGSALSEAAMALALELKKFEDLSAQAARVKLNSEKNLERATEALTRAAESQDRINAQVQKLVAAVQAARAKQETDAAALVARAQQIAGRRGQYALVLERMGALGQMAKEVQDLLREGPGKLDEVQQRMQKVADDAAEITKVAREQDMEDLERQADTLRQQVLSARNKIALLAKKT